MPSVCFHHTVTHINAFCSCETLFKGIVFQAEGLGVANRSSWQETVLGFFFSETGPIGIAISFDVMSCNGISRGDYIPL